MPLKHLKLEWSRAIMQMPKDHIKSHVYIKEKPFLPSYCEVNENHMRIRIGSVIYILYSDYRKDDQICINYSAGNTFVCGKRNMIIMTAHANEMKR